MDIKRTRAGLLPPCLMMQKLQPQKLLFLCVKFFLGDNAHVQQFLELFQLISGGSLLNNCGGLRRTFLPLYLVDFFFDIIGNFCDLLILLFLVKCKGVFIPEIVCFFVHKTGSGFQLQIADGQPRSAPFELNANTIHIIDCLFSVAGISRSPTGQGCFRCDHTFLFIHIKRPACRAYNVVNGGSLLLFL